MIPNINVYEFSTCNSETRQNLLRRSEENLEPFLEKIPPIIEAVRTKGDEALADFAQKFEKAPLKAKDIPVRQQEIDQALQELDPQMLEILTYSAENIRRFHQKQMPQDCWMTEIRPGAWVGERITPIDSVACYVPSGKGAFPSVTLMTVIPAVVAGAREIILLTPPQKDGRVDPATLAAAHIAGCSKIYKAGGAQAVAAAAFGTQSIPRCLKIVGAGSPWLIAAKRLLAQRIDPSIPAGPSESLILADESANPQIAALDLLIESEHGPDSSAFLVTWSPQIAQAAKDAIPKYWKHMSKECVDYSAAVLSGPHGGIIITENPQQAYDFINDYAPEHLQILSKTPHEYLGKIRNASEILLGEYSPGTIANYMMGFNCVLPTGGAARTFSPLGVRDFLKSTSIGQLTREGFAEMAPRSQNFARYEGFDAHANACSSLRWEAWKNHRDSE